MRRYLLDSPIVTGYLKGRKVVTLVEPWVEHNEAATSLLVYGEISEYNHSFPDFTRRQTELRALLQQVYPYGLSYLILERYAQLRRILRPPHGSGLIGDIDTLIVRRDTRTYIPQQLGKNLKGGSGATHLTWN